MASSKLMSSSSSKSRNSDLSRRPSSNSSKPKPKPSPSPSSSSSTSAAVAHQTLNTITTNYSNSGNQLGSLTIDSLFRDDDVTFPPSASDAASSLLDAQIALMDTAGMDIDLSNAPPPPRPKTADEVWQEIVSGGSRQQQKECKEELPDEMMTLEDFLARAGAVEEEDIKDLHLALQPETDRLNGGGGLSGGLFGFDHIALSPFQSIDKVEGGCFGNGGALPEVAASGGGGARGRGKRGPAVLEPLDKAAQQRQRRMIKNRESAARSRERKQAYQVELESLAVRLEEEKERLLKEKAERTEERLKQLMEHVIPIVEKRRPSRVLRRFRSLEW